MCECFICRHKDNRDMLYGYLNGQKEVLQSIVKSMHDNNIQSGKIHETNLQGLLACCEYNLDEVNWLLTQLDKTHIN